MARPIKNNCDYFSHDNNMRNHKKVKALRSKFGPVGYAVWSMVLEYLTGNDGNVFEYSDLEFELMSGDFGVSATEIRAVVDYCICLEMLFNQSGFIHSPSLDERLAPVYLKRGVAKELSDKQRRVHGKFAISNTETPVVSVTEKPQSKVKESTVQKSTVNGSNGATHVATIDQRSKIFYEKLKPFLEEFGKDTIRKFYDYWSEHSEGGRKMRFEKEKVFDIKKRLITWKNRESHGNRNGNEQSIRRADAKIESGRDFGTFS